MNLGSLGAPDEGGSQPYQPGRKLEIDGRNPTRLYSTSRHTNLDPVKSQRKGPPPFSKLGELLCPCIYLVIFRYYEELNDWG